MNPNSAHISMEQLVDIADGRADADVSISTHLSNCSECSAQLERLQRLLKLMMTDKSVPAPDVVRTKVLRLIPDKETDQPSLKQKLIAILSFDSSQIAFASGIRGAHADERQLVYQAGPYELDLRVSSLQGQCVLAGQVLGEFTGGQVILACEGQSVTAAMDEACEFTLAPVPADTYKLQLELDTLTIEVDSLDLR